jgi:hypothetical protein
MARWKLMNAHYLNVPGEQWEYMENDRRTGRPIRTKFNVPRLLDPNDPTCWTNRWGSKDNEEGEVIVCLEGQGDTHDIIFTGDPTPDMVPVDDEARAISAKFELRWNSRPEESAGEYSQSLIDRFQIQMAEVSSKPVEVPGLADLVSAINGLVKSNDVRRV